MSAVCLCLYSSLALESPSPNKSSDLLSHCMVLAPSAAANGKVLCCPWLLENLASCQLPTLREHLQLACKCKWEVQIK